MPCSHWQQGKSNTMEMPIEVRLTPIEQDMADLAGNARQDQAERRKYADRNLNRGAANGRASHILGARGEMACAKSLGLYWGGDLNTFRDGGDVCQYQVRTSRTNFLIVRPRDVKESTYIAVHVVYPPEGGEKYEVWGWMRTSEAKQDTWFRKGRNGESDAWFVPYTELHPIEENETVEV